MPTVHVVFIHVSGDYVEVYTPNHFADYKHYWRSIRDREFVVFQAMACSDVHVALSPTLGLDSFKDRFYDVIIGGWDNKNTALIEYVDGAHFTIEVHCELFVILYIAAGIAHAISSFN